MIKRIVFISFLSVVGLLAISCQDSTLPAGPEFNVSGSHGIGGGAGGFGDCPHGYMRSEFAEVYIDRDMGGSLVFRKGRLDIPPDSISSSGTIWSRTQFLKGNILKNIYEFGPSGTTFDPPATLTLTYGNMHPIDAQTIVLSYFNEETGRWEIVTTMTHDPSTRSFSGPITHFSRYSLSANGQTLQQAEK